MSARGRTKIADVVRNMAQLQEYEQAAIQARSEIRDMVQAWCTILHVGASMECTIEKQELTDDDYVLHIKRQDGSVVKVLIPREDNESYPNKCVSDERANEHGLNCVTEGHYT